MGGRSARRVWVCPRGCTRHRAALVSRGCAGGIRVGTVVPSLATAGATEAESRAGHGDPSGICAMRLLAQCSPAARLETRTKESSMCASRWVGNPRGAGKPSGGSL